MYLTCVISKSIECFSFFLGGNLNVLWLWIFVIFSEHSWLNKLFFVLFFQISSDLGWGIGNLFFWLIWCLNVGSVTCVMSWDVVSFSRSPGFEFSLVFNLLHLFTGWILPLDIWLCLDICGITVIMGWNMSSFSWSPCFVVSCVLESFANLSRWLSSFNLSFSLDILSISIVMSWNMWSFSWSPCLEVSCVLESFTDLSRWFFHVNLCFSLNKIAILESAFNEMEKVTNVLSFLHLINTFEEFWVHLLLEIFIQVNLKISFEESLLSDTDLMHIWSHAHSFNFSLHLRFWFLLNFNCTSRTNKQ